MSSPVTIDEVYSHVGNEGFTRLVAAFYAQIPSDDRLGPMYPPEDLAGAEARLRGFLIYRCGGPATYIEERGGPRLRMRHAPFVITPAARDRWVLLMNRALDQAAFPPAVDHTLRTFLAETATFLINDYSTRGDN